MEEIKGSVEKETNNWSKLPDHSRVWIYASDRELTKEEANRVDSALGEFIAQWAAHGNAMRAEGKLIGKLFLFIAADEEQTKASGCSIDDSVHFVKALGTEIGVDFFNRTITQYEKEGTVHLVKLHEFWAMRKAGVVDDDTIVYNNLINSIGQLKTSWRISFKESWHREMWM